MIYRPVFGYR